MRLAPVAVLIVGVAIQLAALTAHARKLWFFGDDWAFLFHRSLREAPVASLFEPHNEHWSTLPVLAYRTIYSLYGVDSYLPYAVMPIALHAVVTVVLFVMLRNAGVGAWTAVLGALVTLFLAGGAGAENTLWDFQVGFLGSAALGLLAIVALQRWTRFWCCAGVLALVMSLMASGMGLVMTMWAVSYVLLRRGLRAAGLTAAVPALIYVSWYVTFARGASGAPPPDLGVAPAASLRGLEAIWTTALGMEGAGPVMLALLAAVTVLRRHTSEQFALAASGLLGAFMCYVLIGYSRSGLGTEALAALRYVYFGVLLTTPALVLGFIVAAASLHRRAWAPWLSWVLAAGCVSCLGLAHAHEFAKDRAKTIQYVKDRLVAAQELEPSLGVLLSDRPEPIYSSPLALDHLADRTWSTPIDGTATPQARNDVVANLQTGVSVTGFGLASPSDVSWIGFANLKSEPRALNRCLTATATEGARLEFLSGARGAQIRLTTAGVAQMTLVRLKHEASTPVPIRADGQVFVGVAAPQTTLRVFLPRGRVTVCPA